jgi:nitrogen fixation protein FixH
MSAEPTAGPGASGVRGAWIWPAALAAALGIHCLVWVGVAVIGSRDPSFSVEPDYYRKGIAWDAEAAQLRADRDLGWTVKVETDRAAGILGDRRLACSLADREGRPIAGAEVEVETFHLARGADRLRAGLKEEPGGVYAGLLRMRRPGLWEVRLTARQGGRTFTWKGDQPVGLP